MKNLVPVVMSALFLAGCATRRPDLTVYVSPDGSDKACGSRSQPFATIERARDAVREARKTSALSNGVDVIIAEGRYYLPGSLTFNSADSGVSGGEVVYRSHPDTDVSLTGAFEIPFAACGKVKDPAVLKRVDAAVVLHLYCVDLSALGYKEKINPSRCFRMPFPVPELFVDGKRQVLSRWPNEGWATIDKIISEGTRMNSGYVSDSADPNKKRTEERKGGVFTYTGDRPARWNVENGLWLHGFWCFDWFDAVQQVESIDVQKKEIKLMAPHQYGVRKGNPSPRRWRAINLLEELDVPGEYYIDAVSNKLYFWPEENLTPKSRIAFACWNVPVVALENVEHFALDGINIEEGYNSGINLKGCSSVSLCNCKIRNLRRNGVVASDVNHIQIANCVVCDTGTGGISLDGGNRKTLERGDNLIENCHIHDFSIHQLTYSSGIHLTGVGNTASHNLLEGAPHMAVGIYGNDHVFEYNVVSNVCMSSDDAAAYYKGRNPSCRGNVVRYNLWQDIGSPRGHGNAAIYFDDGDGGDIVYGNIFCRCGDPGKGSFGTVFSHGGHDNLAENNIFIDCKRALGSAPWNFKRWSDFLKAPLWQTRLLKEVDITSDVYLKHYPALKGYMDPAPEEKRVNYARRNVFVKCGEVYKKAWELDGSNLKIDIDPGFVDMDGGNFTLRKDSVIFEKIPGFEPIPFNKIGPQK